MFFVSDEPGLGVDFDENEAPLSSRRSTDRRHYVELLGVFEEAGLCV